MVSTNAYSVTINVASEGILDFSYLVSDVAVDLNQIYAGGENLKVNKNPQSFTINGFEPTTSYTLYLAARQSNDKFYPQVKRVDFTTGDFGEEEMTVYNISYNSFQAHIKFPAEVAERGNVLKWALNDYPLYNNGSSIAHKMNMDDEWYGNWFDEDTTLSISNDPEDRYAKWEDGSINEESPFYEPLVPNQLLYLTVGEYEYVSEDEISVYDPELGEEVDNTDGHGKPGYYKALFNQAAYNADHGGGIMPWRVSPLSEETVDDQSQYWYGYYRFYALRTQAPELLEGEVKVDLSGLRPNGGRILLTPDENVPLYAVAVLAPSTWDEILMNCPDQEPATIQAYLTTQHAYVNAGMNYLSGEQELWVEDEVWVEGPGSTYKLVVIALNGEEMTAQNYAEYDITLPEKQMQAPTVEVTAIANPAGEESPYELWFNLKCTSVEAGIPATSAQYAFNLIREWNMSLQYSSLEDIVLYAYNYFDEGEIQQINSAEGCNVMFRTLPGQTYGFGALVLNEEGTNSMAGYVEATSINEALPERVESDYFTSLQGEWTLSATISYVEFNWDTFEEELIETTLNTLVTIGDLTAPESLPEEVYTGYADSWDTPMTSEETDAAFTELKQEIADFNENTRAYNRILCQGYDLYPALWGASATAYASPYDIFYNASQGMASFYGASAAIFDFGPKWYLEVDQQGNLSVPFNSMTMAPAMNHNGTYLVAAINSLDEVEMREFLVYDPETESTGYFPVTVNGDTLTIEPYVKEGRNYYMHLIDPNGEVQGLIISEITLTRGWSGAESLQLEAKPTAYKLESECRLPSVERPKSVTRFAAPRSKVVVNPLTLEQYRANVENYNKRR